MSDGPRFPHSLALPVAETLRDELSPFCERIMIAGSLRREKADVGDMELLCVPKATDSPFGVDQLDIAIQGMLGAGVLVYRLNLKRKPTYGPKNKLLIHVPSGIPLDVFTTDLTNWGMALVVRTGPADFNVSLMARFQAMGYRGHAYAGVTNRNGVEQDCPDEETVFRLAGLTFVQPKDRK